MITQPHCITPPDDCQYCCPALNAVAAQKRAFLGGNVFRLAGNKKERQFPGALSRAFPSHAQARPASRPGRPPRRPQGAFTGAVGSAPTRCFYPALDSGVVGLPHGGHGAFPHERPYARPGLCPAPRAAALRTHAYPLVGRRPWPRQPSHSQSSVRGCTFAPCPKPLPLRARAANRAGNWLTRVRETAPYLWQSFGRVPRSIRVSSDTRHFDCEAKCIRPPGGGFPRPKVLTCATAPLPRSRAPDRPASAGQGRTHPPARRPEPPGRTPRRSCHQRAPGGFPPPRTTYGRSGGRRPPRPSPAALRSGRWYPNSRGKLRGMRSSKRLQRS